MTSSFARRFTSRLGVVLVGGVSLASAHAAPPQQVDPLAPLASPPAASPGPSDLRERITAVGRAFNGKAGIAVVNLRDGWEVDWNADSLLVMHSDGLATRWQLDKYPGLAMRHPALIAGVLYRDFSRGRDDVTVLVASARGLA